MDQNFMKERPIFPLVTAMSLPMQYVYFSMVLMFAFMAVAYLCEILTIILDWNRKEEH